MADKLKQAVENVLVLQGGGSLGAFACGVMKAFAKKNIKFDIISGTSIGAINGAIIAGSKSQSPAEDLENFWLELAESSVKFIPDFYTLEYDRKNNTMVAVKSPSALLKLCTIWGPKIFCSAMVWLSRRYVRASTGLDIPL